MKIIQSRLFERKVKKFSQIQKQILDKHILKIIENSTLGDEKKGDLKGVYFYKFKIENTEYLLSYRFSDNTLVLIMFGPHENYYRDLKKFLNS